ncbi:MAG: presenilin family intramembrane aspartyl protease [bacterium]
MTREEAVSIGVSFYTQTAGWFLTTALFVFATRGHLIPVADGREAYAGLVALSAFALATLFVLLLAKVKAFIRVYSGLVYFALIYGTFSLFSMIWPLPAAFMMIPLAASLLFFSPRVFSQNLVLALALAGVAAQFGSMISFPVAFGLLAILAVYDIVAVNITHHMVAMAKTVISKHLPVVFVMPHRLTANFEHVARFEPGSSAVFLGGGDIALPAILVATAPTTNLAAAVIVGTLAGFLVLVATFLSGKKQHPLPALPFLMLGITVCTVLAVLF